MDPNEVLRLFREALAEQRWHDAAEHADALDGWMTAGGFPPWSWAAPVLSGRLPGAVVSGI